MSCRRFAYNVWRAADVNDCGYRNVKLKIQMFISESKINLRFRLYFLSGSKQNLPNDQWEQLVIIIISQQLYLYALKMSIANL